MQSDIISKKINNNNHIDLFIKILLIFLNKR